LLASPRAAIENVFTHHYVPSAYTLLMILNSRFEKEVNVTLWKRVQHLWTLLTTEEVFDEHGSRGRRKMVRKAPRN
jgi:hypothetical protein